MNLWDRVDAERDAKGLDQAEIANVIGETTSNISRWKKKGYIPPADQMVDMAKLLDTTVEYLVTGRPPLFRLSVHGDSAARLSLIRRIDGAIETLVEKDLDALLKVALVLADRSGEKSATPPGSSFDNT